MSELNDKIHDICKPVVRGEHITYSHECKVALDIVKEEGE